MRDEDFERDDELDAALATYAAVEPRAGLERRVLAVLRARQLDAASRGRRWPVLAALATAGSILVVWAGLRVAVGTFRTPASPGGASSEEVAEDSQPGVTARRDIERPVTEVRPLQKRAQSAAHAKDVEATPRLEQFPAPEALSEQEKLLVRFVEDDPREAVLVAEAQAAQLEREDEEIEKLREEARQVQQER
jgi:hypothetical protein